MLATADTNAVEALEMITSFFEDYPEFSEYARQAYKVAARQGSRGALRFLSPYVPAAMRYQAIPYAVKGGHVEFVRELLGTMSKPGIDLHRAALVTAAHADQWAVMESLLGHDIPLLRDYLATRARERITAQQLWVHGF